LVGDAQLLGLNVGLTEIPIAGHETTAHALAFAMGLLAMYPEVQEKLYDHVVKNVSDPSGAPVSC
jgi:cytochrome P450